MPRAGTPRHRRSRRARFAPRRHDDRTRPRDFEMERRSERQWELLRQQGLDETELRALAGDREVTAMAQAQPRRRRTCDIHAPGDPICIVQDAPVDEEMIGYLHLRARRLAALQGVQQATPAPTRAERAHALGKLAAAAFAVAVFAYAAIVLILSLPVPAR